MHNWKIVDGRLKMANEKLCIFYGLLSSKFHILPTKKVCGWVVYSVRTVLGKSSVVIPSSDFCIHFLRRLCVTLGYFTRVIPTVFPHQNSQFISVTAYLSPTSTALTIKTTF